MKHANSRLFVVVPATMSNRSIAWQYFSIKKKVLNVFEHKKKSIFSIQPESMYKWCTFELTNSTTALHLKKTLFYLSVANGRRIL